MKSFQYKMQGESFKKSIPRPQNKKHKVVILLGIVLLFLVAHVVYTRSQNVVTKTSCFAYTIIA